MKTGYLPQASYAVSNQSLTLKQRKGLRNGCLRACGVGTRSWCLATAIRLMWNEEGDPLVQQPAQVWKKWQQLLRTSPPLRSLLAQAWAKPKLKQLGKVKGRWSKVCGPTTAVIATFLDLGWKWSMSPATMTNLAEESMELLDGRVHTVMQ